jgi:DNA replication protein DnaC
LLVLDDLGTEQAKAWASERIDRIIDWRYTSRLPLVVTTNAKSEDLPERVASRLADSKCSIVVQIDAEKYRGGE